MTHNNTNNVELCLSNLIVSVLNPTAFREINSSHYKEEFQFFIGIIFVKGYSSKYLCVEITPRNTSTKEIYCWSENAEEGWLRYA